MLLTFEYNFLSDKQPTQLKTEPLPDEDRSNIKQPTLKLK